jgi:transcriptional regulator with XRE-family HTH domain
VITADTIQRRLGLAIKSQRKEMGLRQKDVADRSGLHRPTISHIERGEYGVTLDTLKAIARALDVSMWSLLQQAEDKS